MGKIARSLPLTFFSRPFYRELLREWRGLGMGFLVALVAIHLIHAAITEYKPWQQTADSFPRIAASLPAFSVKNGKISIDKPTPYTIRVNDFIERPEESDARDYGKILIDPDYAVTDLDLLARKMQSQMILVLVTSDKIIALDGKGPGIRVHSIADTPDGPIITHEQWGKLAEYIRVWLVPATALCVTVALFIGNLISIFLAAIFATLAGMFTKTVPGFSAAMRLAAAVSIPVNVLLFFLPQTGIVKLILWGGYILFGAWPDRQKLEESPGLA